MKRHPTSEETKQKIRETKIGNKNPMFGKPSWNKGTKGIMKAWNKGKKMSDETKKKVSDSKKKNPTRFWLGKELSNKHKENLRLHHSHSLIGENSPNWRGGITPINKKIRQSSDLQDWRIKVFQRDNFLCQMPDCDKTVRYLNAHHIKTFSKYPELRRDIDNGITLCRRCHEKTLGKEEQFEEMLQIIVTFSSNNTVTNGEKMYISAGTPASSPTVLSCTLSLTESL